MDAAEVVRNAVKMISKRDALASKLSYFVGTFDCSEMTLSDVAKYGVKKLGLDCVDGQEEAAISGFLHNRQMPSKKSSFSMDSSEKSPLSKFIKQ